VAFIAVDGRFERGDGGDWLQHPYSITIIYDFILKSSSLGQRHYQTLYTPDKNFRTYGNLVLYPMK